MLYSTHAARLPSIEMLVRQIKSLGNINISFGRFSSRRCDSRNVDRHLFMTIETPLPLWSANEIMNAWIDLFPPVPWITYLGNFINEMVFLLLREWTLSREPCLQGTQVVCPSRVNQNHTMDLHKPRTWSCSPVLKEWIVGQRVSHSRSYY